MEKLSCNGIDSPRRTVVQRLSNTNTKLPDQVQELQGKTTMDHAIDSDEEENDTNHLVNESLRRIRDAIPGPLVPELVATAAFAGGQLVRENSSADLR